MELFIDKLVSDSVNADHAEVRHIIENAKSGDTLVFSKKEYHFYLPPSYFQYTECSQLVYHPFLLHKFKVHENCFICHINKL